MDNNWQEKTAQQLDCLCVSETDRYLEMQLSTLKDNEEVNVDGLPVEYFKNVKDQSTDCNYLFLKISDKMLMNSFMHYLCKYFEDTSLGLSFDVYTECFRFVNCKIHSFNIGKRIVKLSWSDVEKRQA